ncbi:Gp138 family membrane-puncturing spike protein [Bosea sp. AS-1]|uniref:Gp138 family membrane-puncturing spike protein n=1 Tax=Bosea sp. AS-1 TaxID=2015316 RepID=UPI000B781D72|nr:Gp138 family membrane-puncturing spike protein [Bosea sp. AS-1]
MDARERIADPEEMLRSAIEQQFANFWTSAPGRVVSYDATKQRASVQLTVKGFIKQEDGSQKAVDIPVLQDVPVQFPSGGGQTMTFPVKEGDEVLMHFTSRSPASWQQSGGDQVPTDSRMNNLSNGFAALGFKSDPKALSNVSTEATEVRSDDGNTKISLSGAGGVGITTDKSVGIAAANGVTMSGGTGNINFTGTLVVTGEIILNGIHLSTHKHTSVQTGSGTSGGPTD